MFALPAAPLQLPSFGWLMYSAVPGKAQRESEWLPASLSGSGGPRPREVRRYSYRFEVGGDCQF
jgi:hypothetical protein